MDAVTLEGKLLYLYTGVERVPGVGLWCGMPGL